MNTVTSVVVRAARPAVAVADHRSERASRAHTQAALRAGAPATLATDPESLLLSRCASQIAADAGAGAVVHAAGAWRQAALLCAAIAALPASGNGTARPLVYVPRTTCAVLGADELQALLLQIAALHGEAALLVVAVETKRDRDEDAACRRGGIASARSPLVFDHVARRTGWERCQLWTDGMARYALHVLERAGHAAASASS